MRLLMVSLISVPSNLWRWTLSSRHAVIMARNRNGRCRRRELALISGGKTTKGKFGVLTLLNFSKRLSASERVIKPRSMISSSAWLAFATGTLCVFVSSTQPFSRSDREIWEQEIGAGVGEITGSSAEEVVTPFAGAPSKVSRPSTFSSSFSTLLVLNVSYSYAKAQTTHEVCFRLRRRSE